jgi:ferredoxin
MMQKSVYSITKNDLFDLFSRLARDKRLFVPYEYKDRFAFGEFDPAGEAAVQLGGIRQTEPLKAFLNPAREKIPGEASGITKPVIVAGVKQCDLSSLILQDFVFLKGDIEDPFYAFHRGNTTIISSDCTFARETCFCIAMGGAPYPSKEFDINLSQLDSLFLAEVGTDRGLNLVKDYKTFFKSAREREVNERDRMRENVSLQIRNFIEKRNTPDSAQIKGSVKRQYDNLAMWQDFASTCVECGACNLVCPTCHCFQLFDGISVQPQKTARGRAWDSCLYKTFARVAGGANPRKHLYERLRNRFDKKFAFFPEVLDYTACTGCGRCIEACPGEIDLREVLKGLVGGSWNKPPHE